MPHISHERARQILRSADLQAPLKEDKIPAEVWEAEIHYGSCSVCRPAGLADIFGPLSCEEAFVLAIKGSALLYNVGECGTLQEVRAHEHIYGTSTVHPDGCTIPPKFGEGLSKACKEPVCSHVRLIWNGAPLSAHYDGDQELEHGTERALEIAERNGWDIGPLVQQAPVEKLGEYAQLGMPV